MSVSEPDLRRTWLFGPGDDAGAHAAMRRSGADALILDLEDFTPPERRPAARAGLSDVFGGWRDAGLLVAVRINPLEGEGVDDLAAAMPARPDVVALPMAESVEQIEWLERLLSRWEDSLGVPPGATEILPVCETARGVVDARGITGGSGRVRSAILGAEDLAADLCAERSREAVELDYARRRFVFECRAAGVEPVDAPFTFSDAEGAAAEALFARRLGYRSKALVRPEHARPVNEVFTPDVAAVRRAVVIVEAFDAARARGEDRALVEGAWVEVPTYRNAQRLLDRARRLGVSGAPL
ncbi:MAG: CoA ester lyase [Proteobacteria bacterium]|nr:MAG: CoA ester lyase [Pseudomonadota bacterium]